MTDRAAYARALLANARRYRQMDNGTARAILQLLRVTRQEVAGTLASGGSDFQVYRLRELTRSIERTIAEMEARLSQLSGDAVRQSYELGVQSVGEPLRAAGLGASYYSPSMAQVNILVDYSADLIRNVSAETVTKINSTLRAGVLGGRQPLEVMEQITRILGAQAGKRLVGGVAGRAEKIMRTENMRVFNLAGNSQQQALKASFPELQKRWVATGDSRTRDTHLGAHLRYADNPIPVDEPYVVGGEELMYPLDPAASAGNTINCRCRSVTVHPDIGVIGTAMDSAVTREIGRRYVVEEQ